MSLYILNVMTAFIRKSVSCDILGGFSVQKNCMYIIICRSVKSTGEKYQIFTKCNF